MSIPSSPTPSPYLPDDVSIEYGITNIAQEAEAVVKDIKQDATDKSIFKGTLNTAEKNYTITVVLSGNPQGNYDINNSAIKTVLLSEIKKAIALAKLYRLGEKGEETTSISIDDKGDVTRKLGKFKAMEPQQEIKADQPKKTRQQGSGNGEYIYTEKFGAEGGEKKIVRRVEKADMSSTTPLQPQDIVKYKSKIIDAVVVYRLFGGKKSLNEILPQQKSLLGIAAKTTIESSKQTPNTPPKTPLSTPTPTGGSVNDQKKAEEAVKAAKDAVKAAEEAVKAAEDAVKAADQQKAEDAVKAAEDAVKAAEEAVKQARKDQNNNTTIIDLEKNVNTARQNVEGAKKKLPLKVNHVEITVDKP